MASLKRTKSKVLIFLHQKREAFCRLLQLMKAAHSQQSELDVISVFVGTWNMGINIQYIISHKIYYVFNTCNKIFYCCICILPSGDTPPPASLQTWVTCCGLGLTPDESIASLPHDIYAVGTQDNPQGEREWVEHVRATLRSATNIDFKQV